MTLSELNSLVRQVLEDSFPDEYWVEGELMDAHVAWNGHFYAELIQKDEAGCGILARARVNCWARQFGMLHLRFQHETGETLRSGLQVKLLVRITFHEQYGYALNMVDVDPSYTMGDMARRRREILAQLEADGIINDNKALPLPRLLTRIAVISSQTAAGYGDFCDQLLNNDFNLRFHITLFPSVMQGQGVPESIIDSLQQILASPLHNEEGQGEPPYDLVVIIRGGGATSDLSDFDSYPLASCIAQFPLPVVVGIGHERDQTVLDFVAHTRVKTPTAAAAFVIDHQLEEAALLSELEQRIRLSVLQRLEREHQRLERITAFLPLAFSRLKERMEHQLEMLSSRMATAIRQRLERENSRLTLLEQRLKGLDPERLLKLGYSITLCQGKVVRNAADLKPGDQITTKLEHGTVVSVVASPQKL